MSTFKTRIEDYIGSVGDDTFLGDALTDTAAEILRALPDNKLNFFTEETVDQTSNAININNHKVVSVVRENGTDNQYIECKEVSPSYFRKAQDSNSMFAGTIENPVYTIKNSKVHVFPEPATNNNAVKLETVKFPTITAGQTFIDESGTSEFAQSLTDVVILGATTKALQYLMARVKDSLPAEPVIVLSAITVPTTPSNPTISYSDASVGNSIGIAVDPVANAVDPISDPTDASVSTSSLSSTSTGDASSAYTGPSVQSDSAGIQLTTVVALDTQDVIDDYDGNAVEFDQWWTTAAHLIEDEEDVELAGLQIAKINSYIDAFKAEVTNARSAMEATINDARNATQASIASQRNLYEQSISNAKNTTEVNLANISNLTTASISKMRESTSASIAKMQQSTSAAVARMRESTNVNVQNAARTLEAAIQDYSQEISKFRADTERYSSEVQAAVAEYSNDIQKYSAQVDRYTREYSWYQDQYAKFDAKFKEALQIVIAN
jgi:hypothetical protein